MMQTRTCHLWITQQLSLSGQVQSLSWTIHLTRRICSVPARPQIHLMLVRSASSPALLTLFLDHINWKLCSFKIENSTFVSVKWKDLKSCSPYFLLRHFNFPGPEDHESRYVYSLSCLLDVYVQPTVVLHSDSTFGPQIEFHVYIVASFDLDGYGLIVYWHI